MASGVRCDVDVFKLAARAQSINSESLYVLYFVKDFLFNSKNKIIFCVEDLLLVSFNVIINN